MDRIQLDGRTISYAIRHSQRAKHIRLEVRQGTGLTIVLPQSCETRRLPDILRARQGWILRQLGRHMVSGPYYTRQELKSGDTLLFRGKNFKLIERRNGGSATVEIEDGCLVVNLSSHGGGLGTTLELWYRSMAEILIRQRADELARLLGLTYERLTIRGQKTRWASCSHKGNLSFNWKLMMAPGPVIDYVIIHELVHLREMNHSKKFWALLADNCPRWREHKKWLKDHERELSAKFSS